MSVGPILEAFSLTPHSAGHLHHQPMSATLLQNYTTRTAMSFLYREAGRILQGVEGGKSSLKTLTLGRANGVGGGKGGDENGPKRKVLLLSVGSHAVHSLFRVACYHACCVCKAPSRWRTDSKHLQGVVLLVLYFVGVPFVFSDTSHNSCTAFVVYDEGDPTTQEPKSLISAYPSAS